MSAIFASDTVSSIRSYDLNRSRRFAVLRALFEIVTAALYYVAYRLLDLIVWYRLCLNNIRLETLDLYSIV